MFPGKRLSYIAEKELCGATNDQIEQVYNCAKKLIERDEGLMKLKEVITDREVILSGANTILPALTFNHTLCGSHQNLVKYLNPLS